MNFCFFLSFFKLKSCGRGERREGRGESVYSLAPLNKSYESTHKMIIYGLKNSYSKSAKIKNRHNAID